MNKNDRQKSNAPSKMNNSKHHIAKDYKGFIFDKNNTTIDRIDASNIDPYIFYQLYILKRKPCILYNLNKTDEFSSLQKWDLNYLDKLAGNDIVMIEERKSINGNFGQDAPRKPMKFGDFLSKIKQGSSLHYLTSQTTNYEGNALPDLYAPPISSLLGDLPLRPKLASNLIPYQMNIWLGNAKHGSSSGLHHDFHDNIYVLVRGCKVFNLYSPNSAPNLSMTGQVIKIAPNGLIVYSSHPHVLESGIPPIEYYEYTTPMSDHIQQRIDDITSIFDIQYNKDAYMDIYKLINEYINNINNNNNNDIYNIIQLSYVYMIYYNTIFLEQNVVIPYHIIDMLLFLNHDMYLLFYKCIIYHIHNTIPQCIYDSIYNLIEVQSQLEEQTPSRQPQKQQSMDSNTDIIKKNIKEYIINRYTDHITLLSDQAMNLSLQHGFDGDDDDNTTNNTDNDDVFMEDDDDLSDDFDGDSFDDDDDGFDSCGSDDDDDIDGKLAAMLSKISSKSKSKPTKQQPKKKQLTVTTSSSSKQHQKQIKRSNNNNTTINNKKVKYDNNSSQNTDKSNNNNGNDNDVFPHFSKIPLVLLYQQLSSPLPPSYDDIINHNKKIDVSPSLLTTSSESTLKPLKSSEISPVNEELYTIMRKIVQSTQKSYIDLHNGSIVQQQKMKTAHPGISHEIKSTVLMLPGDALYLPCGFFHEVRSFNIPEEALHLAQHNQDDNTTSMHRNNKISDNNNNTDSNNDNDDKGNGHIAVNYWFHPPHLHNNDVVGLDNTTFIQDSYYNPYKSLFWHNYWFSSYEKKHPLLNMSSIYNIKTAMRIFKENKKNIK